MPQPMLRTRSPLASAHRGFAYALHRAGRGADARFSFTIAHRGLLLHASEPTFRTAASADRAARRFVDDALGAFDYAQHALAA